MVPTGRNMKGVIGQQQRGFGGRMPTARQMECKESMVRTVRGLWIEGMEFAGVEFPGQTSDCWEGWVKDDGESCWVKTVKRAAWSKMG